MSKSYERIITDLDTTEKFLRLVKNWVLVEEENKWKQCSKI